MINAEFLMLLGGVGAFVMTLYWVRVRELRERYAIGWLAGRDTSFAHRACSRTSSSRSPTGRT